MYEGSEAGREVEVGFRSRGMRLEQRRGRSEACSTLEAYHLSSRDRQEDVWRVHQASEVKQVGRVAHTIDEQVRQGFLSRVHDSKARWDNGNLSWSSLVVLVACLPIFDFPAAVESGWL